MPSGDVPVGQDEHGNVEQASRFGQPAQTSPQPKEHFELGEAHAA